MLTEKQQKVLDVLVRIHAKTGEPVGPTTIGLEMGFDYNSASSRTSPVLKSLVKSGHATRTASGKYVPIAH